jgi:hypothetical protein
MKVVNGGRKERCLEPARAVPAMRLTPPRVEIHVIYTTPQATCAALRAADAITQSREDRIHFLVPQVVPLGFPLDRPPVSVAFAELRALGMASECCRTAGVQVQIVLCGNREQCIEKTLRPGSLVMIGSGKHRWLASEQKLARHLRDKGYRVIHVLEQ